MKYPLMVKCKELGALVDAWEKAGEFPAARLGELSAHIAGCAACAAQYGALLPLIERDSGNALALVPSLSANAAAFLADSALRSSRRRSEGRAAPILVAAAAAAVFGLGLLLGGYVERGRQSDMMTVQFVLDAPAASRVSLVGSFNRWDSSADPMTRPGPDKPWEIRVRLRKGSMYAYSFLVDGRSWVEDPTSSERIDDGFGGTSSLLRL
jgi:anti-sigma factor RsiW